MNERENIGADFANALAKSWAELGDFVGNTTANLGRRGGQHKYADLNSISRQINNTFAKNGLSVIDELQFSAPGTAQGFGSVIIQRRIVHISGESLQLRYSAPIYIPQSPNTEFTKDWAAITTYARRYADYSMTHRHISDGKDDLDALPPRRNASSSVRGNQSPVRPVERSATLKEVPPPPDNFEEI